MFPRWSSAPRPVTCSDRTGGLVPGLTPSAPDASFLSACLGPDSSLAPCSLLDRALGATA